MAIALCRTNVLSKFGADLRWMLEKEGINPEDTSVHIAVKDEVERSRVISAFIRDFDAKVMHQIDGVSDWVVVHGMRIGVFVPSPSKEEA